MSSIQINYPDSAKVSGAAVSASLSLTTEQLQGLIQTVIDAGNDINAVFPAAQAIDTAALQGLASLKNDTFLLGFLVSVLNKI